MSAMPSRRACAIVVTGVSVCVLLAPIVRRTPLSAEGMLVAGVAETLARTGSHASDAVPALFVQSATGTWHPPLAVHPTALLLRLGFPLDVAARLPASLGGALTVWLTYRLALGLFGPGRAALLAPLLLAVSPAFLRQAQTPGSALLAVPPVLAWLACSGLPRPASMRRRLVLGGLLLGLGVYAHPAGAIAAAIFFVIGGAVIVQRDRGLGSVRWAVAGAALSLLPAVGWLAAYPAVYPETFGRWVVHAAHLRDPWDGLVAFGNWDVLARRAGLYWSYVSPAFLFGTAEVFAPAVMVLVAAGWWTMGGSSLLASMVVVGALAAPVAAVALDLPRDRDLLAWGLPLAAVLAAGGVDALLSHPRRVIRWVALALLGSVFLALV
jgi:hypothetical protein